MEDKWRKKFKVENKCEKKITGRQMSKENDNRMTSGEEKTYRTEWIEQKYIL